MVAGCKLSAKGNCAVDKTGHTVPECSYNNGTKRCRKTAPRKQKPRRKTATPKRPVKSAPKPRTRSRSRSRSKTNTGVNCPQGYTTRECVDYCRTTHKLKGHDMGRCMARKHHAKVQPKRLSKPRKSSGPRSTIPKSMSDPSNWRVEQTQLGEPGKEGTVLMAQHKQSNTLGAAKTFRKTKAQSTMRKELNLMALAADAGVAATPYAFDYPNRRYIMERMDKTLPELIKAQHGVLTKAQQLRIIELLERIGEAGIYHGDPNPLNFMTDMNGQLQLIDFGFAKKIDKKLIAWGGSNPNMTSLHFLLFSPMQGLIKKGILTTKPDIILAALKKYALLIKDDFLLEWW